MKIVLAPDSFKHSLTALDATRMIGEALSALNPELTVIRKPMADGGEGTATAMIHALGGEWIEKAVTGPLPEMRVSAGYAWFPESREALVEMATASGLPLLKKAQQNPLLTTTYGTGELIQAAVEKGAARIYLAVGGSATVDAGVGAAQALGWRFLKADGSEVPPGGGALIGCREIIPPSDLELAEIEVLCDVQNPLLGPHGAATVYGPQKGATPEMITSLEQGLSNMASLTKERLGIDMNQEGCGAAGGLSAGARAFMNAALVPGAETVMQAIGLYDALDDADWVITGEGCFDAQSLQGKVVSAVVRAAKGRGVRVAVLAGRVLLAEERWATSGIDLAVQVNPKDMELEEAIQHGEPLLKAAASKLVQQIVEFDS